MPEPEEQPQVPSLHKLLMLDAVHPSPMQLPAPGSFRRGVALKPLSPSVSSAQGDCPADRIPPARMVAKRAGAAIQGFSLDSPVWGRSEPYAARLEQSVALHDHGAVQ